MLKIEVYGNDGVIVPDPTGDLIRAGSLTFETGYPAGLYQLCSFYLSRQIDGYLPIYGGNRVVVRDGYTVVYEGYVDSLEYTQDIDAAGILVKCVGAYGKILMQRYYSKIWIDRRVTADIWKPYVSGFNQDYVYFSRDNTLVGGGITIYPLPRTYATGDEMGIIYTASAADPVKRISYTYTIQPAAGSWSIQLDYSSDGSSWTGRTGSNFTTGTGSVVNMYVPSDATPEGRQYVRLRLRSDANQAVTGTGQVYATFGDINIWSESETSPPTLTNICTFIVGKETDINASTAFIGSNTYELTEYTIDDFKSEADILKGAADYGDASFNRWVVGLLDSSYANPADGKPVLYAEAWPDVTAGFDYVVRLDEMNLVGPVTIQQDVGAVKNYVYLRYILPNGETKLLSPLDDPALYNQASVTAYGRRDTQFDGKQATRADALNAAKRYLKQYKDPQWRLDNGLQITGYLRTADGGSVPAAQVRAGKRLKIENFAPDAAAWSWGQAVTMVITKTSYDDETATVNLSFGEPDDQLFAAWSGKYGAMSPEDAGPEHDAWRLYQGIDGFEYKMARLNAQFKNRHGRWNRHNGSGTDPKG